MRKNQQRVRIKICGNTNLKDALLAAEVGADALGFIFCKASPRYVTEKIVKDIISKLPPFVETVGVFVNETAERVNRIADNCKLNMVQLQGDESPAFCKKIRRRVIKAFRIKNAQSLKALPDYKVAAFLMDAFVEGKHGGTGITGDWKLVRRARRYGPVILAGGLDAGNVAEGIHETQPYAVDVCSGVEKVPGKKDPKKLRAFIRRARGLDAQPG